MVYIEGTEHYNFTDLQLYSKLLKQLGMTGDIDGERSADIVNRVRFGFFQQAFKRNRRWLDQQAESVISGG